MNNILEFQHVSYCYKGTGAEITILDDVSFFLKKGETVGLVGPSGSGKSTLLHLAALLEAPNKGEIKIVEQKTSTMKDHLKTSLRASSIGLVYQFHGLLPEFTAFENIVIPQYLIPNFNKKRAEQRARDLLCQVGLSQRMTHRPGELSGGEQQRVALARALANNPDIVLADEPTGNLDPETGHTVMALLLKLAAEKGIALLIATHNHQLAQKMQRMVTVQHRKCVPYRADVKNLIF